MNITVQDRKYLLKCKEALEDAKESGEPERLSIALANYAYALSVNNRREEGMEYFDQAEVIAGKEVSDITILAHGLGLRCFIYQESKRLPDAYKTTKKMLRIAQEEGVKAVECDAIANQAQILLESGEIEGAFQRFQEAETIAKKIGDDHRLMRVKGALANLCLSVPSLEKARAYYQEAISLARSEGDQKSEMGFKGNLGLVLHWQGEYEKAVRALHEVLTYFEEKENDEKVIQVLNKLVHCYGELGEDDKVLEYANKGMELIDKQTNELVFDFLREIIMVYYREGNVQEAHNTISEAISLARSTGDLNREVEFLINLGESYMASGLLKDALSIYRDALEGSKKLDRSTKEAYLFGRIGYLNAEFGNLEEAVEKHLQSIELAQEHHLPRLEGEQRSMLALAYEEMGKIDEAKEQARMAMKIYELAENEEGLINARRLLQTFQS